MASGKKFNIWIAYSDLFSNLAVFLFLSAFGAFAALGVPTPTKPTPEVCPALPADVAAMLVHGGLADDHSSDLKPPASQSGGGQNCATRYTVDVSRIGPGIATAPKNGRLSQPQNDAIDHLCQQLWGAATRTDLRQSGGQIVIVGTAAVRPNAFGMCKQYGDDNPLVFNKGGYWHRIALSDCWFDRYWPGGRGRFHNKSCAEFDACDNGRIRGHDSCGDFNKDVVRNVVRRLSCFEQDATKRAEVLYTLCQRSLAIREFDTTLIRISGGVLDGNPLNYFKTLSDTWNDRVHYRGEVGDDPRGAVYVDVVFDKVQVPAAPAAKR
jgi:hypothetical protein